MDGLFKTDEELERRRHHESRLQLHMIGFTVTGMFIVAIAIALAITPNFFDIMGVSAGRKPNVSLEPHHVLTKPVLPSVDYTLPDTPTVIYLEGEEFPDRYHTADTVLRLAGGGLLTFLGMEVYHAALYVQPGPITAEKLQGPVPKAIVIRYHMELTPRDFRRVANQSISKNPAVDRATIDDKLERLYSAMSNVGPEDEDVIIYEPGEGTKFISNGSHRLTVQGEDFARAIFGIWISPSPASFELRGKLLSRL